MATASAAPVAAFIWSGLAWSIVTVVVLPVSASVKVPEPENSRPVLVSVKSIVPAKLPSPPSVSMVKVTVPPKPTPALPGASLKVARPEIVVSFKPSPLPSYGTSNT